MTAEYNEANGWLERYNQVSAGLYLWAGADSVMRFNEIYGGPANEYDATPWDLEFTNFNVTYEYNYSHDNAGRLDGLHGQQLQLDRPLQPERQRQRRDL